MSKAKSSFILRAFCLPLIFIWPLSIALAPVVYLFGGSTRSLISSYLLTIGAWCIFDFLWPEIVILREVIPLHVSLVFNLVLNSQLQHLMAREIVAWVRPDLLHRVKI